MTDCCKSEAAHMLMRGVEAVSVVLLLLCVRVVLPTVCTLVHIAQCMLSNARQVKKMMME